MNAKYWNNEDAQVESNGGSRSVERLLAFLVEAETSEGIGQMTCFAQDEQEAHETAVEYGAIRTARIIRRETHDMFRVTHQRGVAYHEGAFI